jgi:hypothetical protein
MERNHHTGEILASVLDASTDVKKVPICRVVEQKDGLETVDGLASSSLACSTPIPIAKPAEAVGWDKFSVNNERGDPHLCASRSLRKDWLICIDPDTAAGMSMRMCSRVGGSPDAPAASTGTEDSCDVGKQHSQQDLILLSFPWEKVFASVKMGLNAL